jgi:hypothetical protein
MTLSANDYGFDSTDDIQLDAPGLPVGVYKAMIVGEEADNQGRGIVIEYEVLEGDTKGKRGKQWLLTKHDNPQTANIAKQNVKRIADATGRAVSGASPLKGRVLTIDVQRQKKNPDYTEIKRYLAEDYKPAVNDEPPV